MPTSRTRSPRTQFFAAALETLMERNGINQVELSAATGIAVSRVNNYLHGRYRTIRPDHLGLMAKAAGRTAAERGGLARAYVEDLLPEELRGLVRLAVAGAMAASHPKTPSPKAASCRRRPTKPCLYAAARGAGSTGRWRARGKSSAQQRQGADPVDG